MMNSSILIIEDDENIRKMYTDAFVNAGFSVLTAENGEDGIEIALNKHPDILLVDIGLPGISGHEVVNTIRKDDWGRIAKVIFLTNFSDPENVVHAVEEGSEEYIVKANTDIHEVVNKVRAAL